MSTENHITNRGFSQEEFSKMSQEEKILKLAEGLELPLGKPEDEVLELLLARLETTKSAKVIPLYRYLGKVAVLLLLVIGTYFIFNLYSNEKVTTKYSQHAEVILPDGTCVVLNAGSVISYSKRNFSAKRSLELEGEAFFSVKKGSQFIIQTPKGKVEIFGTELNVFCRNKEFWVSCLSGKVGVTVDNKMVIILSGELAELTSGGLAKSGKNNIENTSAWKEGWCYFEDRPLVSIFDEIERQFNVKIETTGLEGRYFTGSFSNKDLNEALDVVCSSMDLKYELQKNRKVVVSFVLSNSVEH